MNCKSSLVLSIVVLTIFAQFSPTFACFAKIKTLLRNKGKTEKPAELARDESSFIKYAHSSNSNFYIEIIQNENKTFVVRELDYPPITLNQVAGDAVSTMKPPPEPDAEYIDANGTVTSDKEDSPQAVAPTEASPANPSSNGEGEEEEEILTPEDEGVRREWGGNCTTKDWERCNKIRQIVVLDVINNQFQRKNLELDCLLEPILCLRNGWTCNRCHIMCMAAQCNKQLFYSWDDTVDFEGPCRYRK